MSVPVPENPEIETLYPVEPEIETLYLEYPEIETLYPVEPEIETLYPEYPEKFKLRRLIPEIPGEIYWDKLAGNFREIYWGHRRNNCTVRIYVTSCDCIPIVQ